MGKKAIIDVELSRINTTIGMLHESTGFVLVCFRNILRIVERFSGSVALFVMADSMPPANAPFQNLKFAVIINKIMGLVSCKLVNGRLKPGGKWSRCYCTLWILFHCAYTCLTYYEWYIIMSANDIEMFFFVGILRYNAFFASLLPYHYVAVLKTRDFAKFSDKLETYDDKATVLGYRRKDKNIFTWLYFIYTLGTLTMKIYYGLSLSIEEGTTAVLKTTFEVIIPTIIGTYCVFITVIYLDLIRQRFRHLNKKIVPRVSELPVTGSPGEITVYDVRYLHGVLIDSAELINVLYGIGTLATFTSILLEFISVIYLFVEDIEDNNAIVTILDLCFQATYLFAMYHFTALEDKIEMMLYFYHARFYFTAAEFFMLDLTIFLSISSTVTTFITIII